MRLRRLLIEQYGNFECLDLALAAEPGRINLIVAPNGAGKSVLRQAFHDLLFGYGPKTRMNFRYSKGLNLQAEAITQSGEDLQFGWRHPGGRAFDGADATAATRFGAALGGIKPPQLENLFALDTARLRAGGEELAQGGDSLGLALLSGTGELMSAKTARAELGARRDEIWAGTRLSGRPLAKAARSLDDARKKARGAVQLPVQRVREMSALEAERARLDAARETHAAMQAKASRLARIDRTRRFLEEHRAAAFWLAEHQDAPVLAPTLADDLAAARRQASLTAAKLTDAEQAVATETASLAALVLDQPALDRADELSGLEAARGSTAKAAADIVGVRAKLSDHLTAIATALRDLGAAIPVEQAATLLPRRADEAAARQLIAEHTSRQQAHESAARRVRQAQLALDRLAEESVAAPAALDALEILVQTIRADRDPARHLAETAQAAAKATADETAALAAIPGWPGTMAELRAQPTPSLPAFERLDKDRTLAAAALREVEGERDRLAETRRQWTRTLQEMDEQPLPSQTAIAQARIRRDGVWTLIFRQAFKGETVDAAERQALAGGDPLELAFPSLIRTADDLVDKRLEELPRAKEQERLTRELLRTAAAQDHLDAACETARQALDAAERAFAVQCTALGLDHQSSIADIRHTLAQRSAALTAGRAADLARGTHQAVLDAQAKWTGQLRHLLPTLGDAPFTALLAAADARLRAEAEAKEARIQHAANQRNAVQALAEANADLQAATAALDDWRQLWADCLTSLGRPATETPAATEAVLQCLTGLASSHAAASSLGQRVADMEHDIAAFGDSVTALAGQLGVEPGPDSFATARRLIARHESAQKQRTLFESATSRQTKTKEALRLATERERTARRELDAIIAACGATDGEDAERRIALSRERARQEDARDAAAAGLATNGDGLSLAELHADAESVTADKASGERRETEIALAAARDASEAAARKVSELERALDAAATATDLSESIRSQEGAAATFGRLLDDYLVLSLAEQMLARSVAEVEAKAGSNGVSRIAAAFARVTNDDYTIESEEGPEGKTILIAVERRWPNEKKALAQLSEGTRDQLYLALRIVAIEDHTRAAAALPFVADDILQTFDDARALAALHALLALSQHTQIIVLTHHPHLAALAATLPPGSVHLAAL
jgi:uncharacterized protein YhaN